MINKKSGSERIINLISIIVTVLIILAIGLIYYIFFSPSNLELKTYQYTKINQKDYEIDREFEQGLDTTIDIRYTDRELDMHKNLKDYYQGREDPFSTEYNRDDMIELDGERAMNGEEVTYSKPDQAPTKTDEEQEININNEIPSQITNSKSILNF